MAPKNVLVVLGAPNFKTFLQMNTLTPMTSQTFCLYFVNKMQWMIIVFPLCISNTMETIDSPSLGPVLVGLSCFSFI